MRRGTIARPVGVVERAATEGGLAELGALVREHEAERVVVGMPLTLRGEHGAQALETDAFVEALRAVRRRARSRRTTSVSRRRSRRVRAADSEEDARAAAHLLESYLAEAARR